MNKIRNTNLKKLLTLIVALTMAFCLVFCVACSDVDSSSSSDDDDDVTVTATDYQLIKNGDFEFGTDADDDDDEVSYPVYTGINWTKYRDNSYSTSAISSSKNSGIIDTQDEAYNKIASANDFPKNADETYWNPKTPQAYGLGGDHYVYDEETASENPNEDKLPTSGSKILMIHNVSSEKGVGTAQKFVSSSSLTTSTGYAKISVWVLTKDLTSIQQGVDYGAYISVNNTLSSSRTPFILKNIDTKGVWANYVIYLEVSDYASSSYTVTVGLGFGSDTYQREYVEGFAYFDDIHFQELTEAEYNEATEGVTKESLFNDDGTEKEDLSLSQSGKTYDANDGGKATTVKYVFSHLIANNLSYDGAIGSVNGGYTDGLPTAYQQGFNTNVPSTVTLPVASAKTVAIVLDNPSSYSVTTGNITIEKDKPVQINFLTNVMVAQQQTQTGATIQLEEVDEDGNVLGTFDVTSNFNTYSTDEKGQVWKTVSIFINNEVESKNTDTDLRYVRFKFTLGTTDIKDFHQGNYENVLTKGYALFTAFEGKVLSEEEYNIVSSNADYTSTVTLSSEYVNAPSDDDDDKTDDFAFTATASTKANLKNKPATGISGYTGVTGGTKAVGGEASNVWSHKNGVSGIVSSKYIDNYGALDSSEKSKIKSLAGDDTNIQPIIIKNYVKASYGYIGSALTFSANTTTLVSVQVKVLDSETNAYVYLTNSDSLSDLGVLDISNGTTTHDLAVKVTSASKPTDGWVTVNFLVTAGENDISYRIELWNGSRDGNAKSVGSVLFNKVTISTATDVNALTARLDSDFGDKKTTMSYQRPDTTVTATDEDGEDYEYTISYEESVVYTEYTEGSTIIASYETIDASDELDLTTSDDEDTDDDDEDTDDDDEEEIGGTVWALQITSIIVAAVLVAVLLVVIIRMLIKKHKKAVISSDNYYNRNSRENAQAVINANKARRAEQALNEEAPVEEKPAEETTETEEVVEEKPYDYDNPENNI